jgi:alanine-glyoxylate transaminase/serine-glyoxylate transaminase/serine-pyruvate transaminase
MSLGTGLGQLADKAFRIGHLRAFNDLTLAGAPSGVEMGLPGGISSRRRHHGGAGAAFDLVTRSPRPPT